MREFPMLIDGEMVSADAHFPVENPATLERFAEAPDASEADLDRAVSAARRAFPEWAKMSHAERCSLVMTWAQRIENATDDLAFVLTSEQGKPLADARKEVGGMVAWLRAAAQAKIPVHVHEDTAERYCETRHVPIGVVAAIAPWNYPLLLASFKLGPALVTGNCVVLKPSPFTPLSTLAIGAFAQDIFPPGVLNVISGGDQLGPQLTSHAGIDKVSFTGSTETGRKVMASAASTLKRLTLELGGNDPAIVMHDADPSVLAERLFWACFGNAGQVCLASKRVYVHSAIYGAMRDALVDIARKVKVGDGTGEGVQIGPVNNPLQHKRVCELIEDAKAAGHTVIEAAESPDLPGYFIAPTIIENPDETARIVQEEQFGPVVPLIKFDDYDDAIARANASEFALGASIWTADEEAGWALAERIEAGNVWVNEARPLSPLVPFAGHKQSGFGVENGAEGILEYTIPKTMSRALFCS